MRVRVEEDDSERDRGAGGWSWRDLRRFEREERFFLFESEEVVVATGAGSTARKGARLSTDKRRLRTHVRVRGQCPGLTHCRRGNWKAHCSAKWRMRLS